MKLSSTKCGLDIVWDGRSNKLPLDMGSHACAVYNKRVNEYFVPHVMMCAPYVGSKDDSMAGHRCWRLFHKQLARSYLLTFHLSTPSISDDMVWLPESNLNGRHVRGAMVQHNGRLHIHGFNNQDRFVLIKEINFQCSLVKPH